MQNNRIRVELGSRSYDIIQASLDSEEALEAVRKVKGGKVLLTADSNTACWLPQAESLFRKAGKEVFRFVFPAGEASKTMENVMAMCSAAVKAGMDRSSLFAALGGGVTGDLTGFASSLFMRGTGYIQIPTSLLAMVDSSVGGKTAVDTPAGKNLMGTFHQPSLVLMDESLLRTLPARELRNGMAEVVKYAILESGELSGIMEKAEEKDLSDPEFLKKIIASSCRIKAKIVAADEQETSPDKGRILLNYGHTFGHALEHLSGFRLSHGESVAWGMEMAACTAFREGLCGREVTVFQKSLLDRFCGKRPPIPEAVTPARIAEVMKNDKKNRSGKIRTVLPVKTGELTVREFEETELLPHLESFFREMSGSAALPEQQTEKRIRVSVLGLGLLGTSLMLALDRKRYRVSGWCRNPETAKWAISRHTAEQMFSTPEEAFQNADLAVLALPADVTVQFMKQYAPVCPPSLIVTDIASVKHDVMAAAESLPELNFIGSHPMAGTEKSGPYAAFPELYENADVFLIPGSRTSDQDMEKLSRFWSSLHTHPRIIGCAEHDRLCANTSHSLHVIASALAMSILDEPDPVRRRLNFAGCATGFRDTSRIASSSPEMWREICESNRDEILPALDRFQERLDRMRKTLEERDFADFECLFRKGRYLRDSWLCYKRASALPAGIVLCGIKSAGKTTVSQQISAILEKESVDTDRLLEERYLLRTGAKKTVREIYRELGEEKFRLLEAETVRSLADGKKRIISLGGGAAANPFLSPDEIRALGFTVFLDVPDRTAYERILKNGLPPFLEKENDPFAAFVSANEKRRKAFGRTAHVRIVPGEESPYDTASHILSLYKEAYP